MRDLTEEEQLVIFGAGNTVVSAETIGASIGAGVGSRFGDAGAAVGGIVGGAVGNFVGGLSDVNPMPRSLIPVAGVSSRKFWWSWSDRSVVPALTIH